jgi:F0F1-type ATP synthase assembly protein I
MNEDEDNKSNYLKEYSKYSSLIFQMIAIAVVGVLGGIELDKWLKMKSPVFTISLTIIMTVVALIHLFRTLLRK